MPKQTYPPKWGKKTLKHLQEITRFGYSLSNVFSDFVDIFLTVILSRTENLKYTKAEVERRFSTNQLTGPYEDRYLKIVGRYKENKTRNPGERPVDFFDQACTSLQEETLTSLEDVLGDIYESQISYGEHGQFFTPPNIARLIVEVLGAEDGEKVHEPAVGSGRIIIAAAKENPNRHFNGIDVSPVCARMCAINMWLFDLSADIYEGNTLSMELSYLWTIRPGGWIWESKIGEDGKPDSTVDAWLAEFRSNHPLTEAERQAMIEEYESLARIQKLFQAMQEMEKQFQSQRKEQPVTVATNDDAQPDKEVDPVGDTDLSEQEEASTPAPKILPMVVVAERYQRIDNYQEPDETDSPFTVAFVLPNDETLETIDQCLEQLPSHAWKGGIEIQGFPVLLTTEEYASQIEEALITARGSVEPTQGTEDTGRVEVWTLPDQTAATGQASLFADLPPEKEKPAKKKKSGKQTDPQQQSLF